MQTEHNHSTTKNYKARFRIHHGQPEFVGKKAMMLVSVGQNYHEQDKLLATIKLINKERFAECNIALGDTLQRYNFDIHLAPEKARNITKRLGDEWIERNHTIIEQLQPIHQIHRWDDIIKTVGYEKCARLVTQTYDTNADYKAAIDHTIHTYLQRARERHHSFDEQVFFDNSKAYLLEEFPAIMPLWSTMGYDYIMYPKPITHGMNKTRELFVADQHPDKCQWLYIKLKRKS